jgi:DUF1707 SHOCT-like domain
MVTGPGDELAAAAAGRGRLRVSHADREQVIDTLKAAFVQGMLAKDEFDLRVSQAFASRTYAELAAVTANLPAEPTAAQPPRPARTPDEIMQRPGRMMAVATALYAGVWAFVWLLPWPRNSEGDPPHPLGFLFFPSTLIYPLVLLIGVVNMVALWHEKRSGRRPPHPPSAGPDVQLPPGDHGHQRPYGPRPDQVPD